MKRKYGPRGITFFLSTSASVFSAYLCVLLMAGEYYSARNKLDIHNQEFQGWETCRQTDPTYFGANAEAVSRCLINDKNSVEQMNIVWQGQNVPLRKME